MDGQVSIRWYPTWTRGIYWISQMYISYLNQVQLEVHLPPSCSMQVGSKAGEKTLLRSSTWHSWTCFITLEMIGVTTQHSMLWGNRVGTVVDYVPYCYTCIYVLDAPVTMFPSLTCIYMYMYMAMFMGIIKVMGMSVFLKAGFLLTSIHSLPCTWSFLRPIHKAHTCTCTLYIYVGGKWTVLD